MTKMFGWNMRNLSLTILFVLVSLARPSNGYRILGLFPYNGASHFLMFERLMKGLAERGHQVDIVGHHPLKKSFDNYNDIIDLRAPGVQSLRNNLTYDFAKQYFHKKTLGYAVATEYGNHLCESMSHPKFTDLVINPPTDPPYDLVIAEVFGSHCYLSMGQHLGVPVVGVVTSAMWPWVNDMVANPDDPAFIPQVFFEADGKMNFWERIENTVTLLYEKWQFNYYTADQDGAIRKYIGDHVPNVRDAERNVSLILVNSHFTVNGVRPFTTAVVEVGGLHIPPNADPLPNILQQWLDESNDGFVYISFGSMMKIESFPKEVLSALYRSMEKLAPIRVLMKIAQPNELPSGLPKNVLTHQWIPQLAVLRHKNIRAFVTHGGLMGTQEAIDSGVPMIGVPLFADQIQNIRMYVNKGIAVFLHYQELTEKNIDAAFNAVLHNPTYMKASKRLAAEFRDRPITVLDTAIFWVEYVVRHGGTNLRSPAMDLAWWQARLLDVYGALLLGSVIAVYVLTIQINKLSSVVLT